MEVVVVLAAFVGGAILLARGLYSIGRTGDEPPREQRSRGGFLADTFEGAWGAPSRALAIAPAAVLPRMVPLRIYSGAMPTPNDRAYSLTFVADVDGRWTTRLSPPADPEPGDTLTLMVHLPWHAVAASYSGVDLVVR